MRITNVSRPRSESGGPAAAASNRRRRALTFEDLSCLPKYMKLHVLSYVRPAFTNETLRAAIEEYFATYYDLDAPGGGKTVTKP